MIYANRSVRQILCQQAASFGCIVEGVSDGSSACEVLAQAARESHPFSVALVDLNMGGIADVPLDRCVHGYPQLKDLKLIGLTSLADRGKGRAERIGCAMSLVKPVKQSDLSGAIQTLMLGDAARVPPLEEEPRALESGRDPFECRILLAEDNDVNRVIALAMLQATGYSCAWVSNGKEAVAEVARGGYDLVLMDCRMPEMDGFTATEEIRKHERTSPRAARIPIIALTANVRKSVKSQCRAAGMDDYLSEPFTLNQLSAAIAQWLPSENVTESKTMPRPTKEGGQSAT